MSLLIKTILIKICKCAFSWRFSVFSTVCIFSCFETDKKILEPRHEISNNVVCATIQASDQPAHMCSLIRAFASLLDYSMTVNLLAEHHLESLSLKGGFTGSSESSHVKMPLCWKSHVEAHFDNEDHDEIPQNAAIHQVLHWLLR